MKTKCNKCHYEWDYKGESEYFVTCPRCLSKVDVRKQKEEEKQ